MDNIKKQTNIIDDELILKTYNECNNDEFKTILKLLNIEKENTKNIQCSTYNNEIKNEIEMFRNIMKVKEEYFYNKLNNTTQSSSNN